MLAVPKTQCVLKNSLFCFLVITTYSISDVIKFIHLKSYQKQRSSSHVSFMFAQIFCLGLIAFSILAADMVFSVKIRHSLIDANYVGNFGPEYTIGSVEE
uniref:7TM_GPCR_Srx domain-containing protein n=1 Tax=Steinernema glaseri TaxID=37863 RepID=A0A1I8ABX5_9BILA